MSKRTDEINQERRDRERQCKICGHKWMKRRNSGEPLVCPLCKNTGWDVGRTRAKPKPSKPKK